MKKVKIIDINNYDYTLIDSLSNKYILNITFYDVSLQIGDYIILDENILKEKNLFNFGPVKDNYDKKDIIKIIRGNKQIYLQRYYG